MLWYDEMKPYFIRSRMSGHFPFSLIDGKFLQSKGEYVFAIFAAIFRINANIWAVIYVTRDTFVLFDYFGISHTTSVCLSLLYSTYKGLTNFTEMKVATDLIRKYDDAVRLRTSMKKLVIFNWSMIILCTTFEICFNLSQYDKGFNYDILCFFIFTELNLIWWNSVLEFTAIVFSMARRFRNLHNLLVSDTTIILDEKSSYYRSLYLEDVHRLHGYLVAAAKYINSMYTIPLLLWTTDYMLKLTWSIYALLAYSEDVKNTFSSSFTLAKDLIVLGVLLFACNEASVQANKIGYVALSPNSCIFRRSLGHKKYKNVLGGQYFMLNPLHFSAAYGLYRVDLLLMYTLLGALTTLLVNIS